MKYCSKCGKELSDEEIWCPTCDAYNGSRKVDPRIDTVSVPLCVASGCFPWLAIIYWALKRDEYPKRARACLLAPFIAFGGVIVLMLLISVVLGTLFGGGSPTA